MKRRMPPSDGKWQKNSRQREADNPYLAHLQGRRKKTATAFDPSVAKRKWREGHALYFHGEEEEEAEEEGQSRPGSTTQRDDAKPTSRAVDEFFQSVQPLKSDENDNLPSSSTPLPPLKNLDTPAMEWWDVVFLPKPLRTEIHTWNPETAPYDQLSASNNKSSLYVEHPVPMPPTKASMDSDEPLKLYKTKREMKRERRLRRALANKEKQDQIALGLIPPPPPKIRLSNLLRVLGSEHAADPSAVEAKVKEEMELRQRQHEARNLAKKLTPLERIAKVRRRVEKDAKSPFVHVCVFRVTNFELMQEQLAKKRMVKMLLNAKKLMINGRVITVKAPTSVPTLVYIEGGPKSVRKFKRLMLKRIDWKAKNMMEAAVSRLRALQEADESSSEEEEDDASSSSSSSESLEDEVEMDDEMPKKSVDGTSEPRSEARSGVAASCRLVWEGVNAHRMYDGFHREVLDSALDARAFMQGKNLGHLWDAVINAPSQND